MISRSLRCETVPLAGPPRMPVDEPIRVIRVTRNMLAIHWSPPYDDGGYPIERYIVEKREASRSHWTQVGVCAPDVTAFCVTDLAENQVYYFRVIAETAFGFSEPLELDKPIVPRRIFGTSPAVTFWRPCSRDVVLEASRGGLETVFLAGSASPRPHTILPRSCLGLDLTASASALPHSFCLGLGSVWKVAHCLGSAVISQLKRASAHGAQVQV